MAEEQLVRPEDRNAAATDPYRDLIATCGQLVDVDESDWLKKEFEALEWTATV